MCAPDTHTYTHEMSLLKSILDTSSTDYTGDTAHLHLPPPPSAPNRPGTSRGRYGDDGQLGDASESRGVSNITIRARGGHMMDDDAKVGRRFASEDDLSSRGSGKTHRKKRRIRPRMQYVYVDSGADRLQEKYEELRNLLTDNRRSVTRRRRYDDELAKQARDAILQHEYLSRGVTRPMSGRPRNRPMSAHPSLSNQRPRSAIRPSETELSILDKRQRQCHRAVTWLDLDDRGTQTKLPARPRSAKQPTDDHVLPSGGRLDEYVLIDATNTQDIQTRKVAFVEQYESSPRGPPGLTYNNNSVQRPKSAKARLSRSPERRPRSAKITNRSPRLSSLEARIASLEAGKKGSAWKSPSSSTQDISSASEKSRNRSKSNERSDHQLKNTENEKLLTWLKEKDKIGKVKRTEERKEKRKKSKEQKLEDNQKEERKKKSETKVKIWLDSKKKEQRLLEKRNRKQKGGLSNENNMDSNDMDNVETVIGSESALTEHKKDCQASAIKDDVGKNGRVVLHPTVCTCGFTAKQRKKNVKQTKPKIGVNKNYQYRIPTAKKEKEVNTSQSEDSELQKRLSYESWLKSKEEETHSRKHSNKNESPADASTEQLITDIGQKRIDAIRRGKKPVDSGDEEIDEISNNAYGHIKLSQPSSYTRADLVENTTTTTVTMSAAKRPPQSKSPVRSSAQEANTPRQSTEMTPRPKTPKSPAFNKVKREQKSWENFADNVWKQVNEDEERPEPQGSDKPDENTSPSAAETPKPVKNDNDGQKEGIAPTKDVQNNDIQSTSEEDINKSSPKTKKVTIVEPTQDDTDEDDLRDQMSSVMGDIMERSKSRLERSLDDSLRSSGSSSNGSRSSSTRSSLSSDDGSISLSDSRATSRSTSRSRSRSTSRSRSHSPEKVKQGDDDQPSDKGSDRQSSPTNKDSNTLRERTDDVVKDDQHDENINQAEPKNTGYDSDTESQPASSENSVAVPSDPATGINEPLRNKAVPDMDVPLISIQKPQQGNSDAESSEGSLEEASRNTKLSDSDINSTASESSNTRTSVTAETPQVEKPLEEVNNSGEHAIKNEKQSDNEMRA